MLTFPRIKRRGRPAEISRILLVCGLAGFLATGCRKEPPPVEQKTTAPTTDAAAAPAAPSGAETPPPVPVPNANIAARAENALRGNASGEVNQFLTQQLRVFIKQKGRLPVNFAEFAYSRLDGVPGAPNGMKWAIDSTSQEVKAVAK